MDQDIKNTLICTFSGLGAFCLVTGMIFLAVSKTNEIPAGTGGLDSPVTAVAYTEDFVDTLAEQFTETETENISLSYISYRVRKGDMIGKIAERHNVTQDTLISINNIHNSRSIQPGQYLKIPSMTGILYTVKKKGETPATVAKKFSVDLDKCVTVNNIEPNKAMEAGFTMFVPDAALDWLTLQEINGDMFRKPIRSRYYLSSYFGWRQNPFNSSLRTYHNGIDMACSKGTSIYSAMAGTVLEAGYNRTYGYYVIVQHHSGYKTLYGHMMEPAHVVRGQNVTTDTRIGRVGSTGLSTGPHLHFTVFKNGVRINPLTLFK